jgi:hypothetical protein
VLATVSVKSARVLSFCRTQAEGIQMPVVKVWGLPHSLGNPQFSEVLAEYRKSIIVAVLSVEALKLDDRRQVTVVFPAELTMNVVTADTDNLQLVVEISGLLKKRERTQDVRKRLAFTVGQVVQSWYPTAFVECFVESFDSRQGFWCSLGSG